MLSFYSKDYERHKQKIEALKASFISIPVEHNLVLNLVSFSLFIPLMNWVVGFSVQHQTFVLLWSILPIFTTGVAYYFYLYGDSAFRIPLATLLNYVHNGSVVCGISVSCSLQMIVWHVILNVVEKALPNYLQGTISFPLSVIESSLQQTIVIMYGFGILLILATPVWVYAYSLNLELLDRKGKIFPTTVVIEILYTTAQFATVSLMQAIFAIVWIRAGLEFHGVHLISEMLLGMFSHQAALIKFAWVHQLVHEIRPLYALTHIEHHLCQGIYPTTSAFGLWELFLLGGSIFLSPVMGSIPFLSFQLLYCGINIVIHTMWPSRHWAQWHTSHHVVHADVYAINVPSSYDERFSSDLARFRPRLERESPFVRLWWSSDAVGMAFVAISSLALHYVGGVGLGHVWHEGVWTVSA